MKLKYLMHSKKLAQGLAFAFVLVVMIYGVMAQVKPQPKKTFQKNIWASYTVGPVKSQMTLSQSKILQGSGGEIYMKIDLEALDDGKVVDKKRLPTDFVVVLDRSGSMSGKNKMTYAHKAIESLLWQMNEQDRFSLVTFDDRVEIPVPLRTVTQARKSEIISLVKGVTPRGSTNLGAGLQKGMLILKGRHHIHNAKRLIIISDGMTNAGITSTPRLNKIASGAVNGEFVISTIGVGLDFNEELLSSLADHGTGNYHFLEKVAKLDKILADEFYGASQILAKQLRLELNLHPAIQVVDASGYPLTRDQGKVIVQAGHLYQKQKKSFFVTLRLPSDHLYDENLGKAHLSYAIEDQNHKVDLTAKEVRVACLPVSQKQGVFASVDKDTYTQAWTQNNMGTFLKRSGRAVGLGNYRDAKKEIKGYRQKLEKAYEVAPSPVMKQQLAKLDQIENEVDDAEEAGEGSDSSKRVSKKFKANGTLQQRATKKLK